VHKAKDRDGCRPAQQAVTAGEGDATERRSKSTSGPANSMWRRTGCGNGDRRHAMKRALIAPERDDATIDSASRYEVLRPVRALGRAIAHDERRRMAQRGKPAARAVHAHLPQSRVGAMIAGNGDHGTGRGVDDRAQEMIRSAHNKEQPYQHESWLYLRLVTPSNF
jgi:hypothetical protein